MKSKKEIKELLDRLENEKMIFNLSCGLSVTMGYTEIIADVLKWVLEEEKE